MQSCWARFSRTPRPTAAERGACEEKFEMAKKAKQEGSDALHDTIHEMAKDEARHAAGFTGLYNRYFKK